MVIREVCLQCGSTWYKRNGHIHTGKQNHCCKLCGQAFVRNPENHLITEEQRTLIERLLLKRISLRGSCRAVGVGLRWLLQFMVERFQAAPEHLHVEPQGETRAVILQRLKAEVDELWSFVGAKENRHWVWIATDATTRQVLAFHVGDRSGQSAQALWEKIPAVYQEQAAFYTDQYEVYKAIIPAAQHRAISKLARKTNHVERFNCTLRQRVSRLVPCLRNSCAVCRACEARRINGAWCAPYSVTANELARHDTRACHVIVLQEAQQSHWSHPLFHL